jgi:hypothetical protein
MEKENGLMRKIMIIKVYFKYICASSLLKLENPSRHAKDL